MAPTNNTSTDNQQQGGDQGPPSGNGGETPNSGPPGASVFTHQVEHSGVVCDNCNKTIFGFRYKCCQCKDFDLCSTCERNGLHAGHVMLRIAFPEQANEAIRSYILKSSPRTHVHGPETIPLGFIGGIPITPPCDDILREHARKRHCKRERHSAHHTTANAASSPDSSDETQFPWGPRCPVMLGKKEIKKWAKNMKKTAHIHKRSAQAYASQVAGATSAASASAAAGGTAEAAANGTEKQAENSPPAGFDFSAAASQIQEFLNAFGVPIDVVELYDEWGNRGAPTAPSQQANSTNTQTQTQAAASGPSVDASTQQGGLADDLQRMNLEEGNSGDSVSNREAGAAAPASGMDVEGEAGWTLLDDKADSPTQSENGSASAAVDTTPPNEPVREIPIAFDTTPLIGPAVPVIATEATASTSSGTGVTNTGPTQAQPGAGRPLYPQLPPHLQQVMSGLANTVGNVVRNIPIVPWNEANGAQPGSPSAPPNTTQPELNDRMQLTLNQLLSMGFSNHDGWLARLVVSKNGNLEEVLNSLFPVGSSNTSA